MCAGPKRGNDDTQSRDGTRMRLRTLQLRPLELIKQPGYQFWIILIAGAIVRLAALFASGLCRRCDRFETEPAALSLSSRW